MPEYSAVNSDSRTTTTQDSLAAFAISHQGRSSIFTSTGNTPIDKIVSPVLTPNINTYNYVRAYEPTGSNGQTTKETTSSYSLGHSLFGTSGLQSNLETGKSYSGSERYSRRSLLNPLSVIQRSKTTIKRYSKNRKNARSQEVSNVQEKILVLGKDKGYESYFDIIDDYTEEDGVKAEVQDNELNKVISNQLSTSNVQKENEYSTGDCPSVNIDESKENEDIFGSERNFEQPVGENYAGEMSKEPDDIEMFEEFMRAEFVKQRKADETKFSEQVEKALSSNRPVFTYEKEPINSEPMWNLHTESRTHYLSLKKFKNSTFWRSNNNPSFAKSSRYKRGSMKQWLFGHQESTEYSGMLRQLGLNDLEFEQRLAAGTVKARKSFAIQENEN